MGALNDVRTELAGKLAAAGLTATLDPVTVPPFVLVGAPSATAAAGIGGWSVDFPIHVVAAPPGNLAALQWMLDQTEAVWGALGFAPAFPGIYGVDDNPAYQLTYRRDVANPDC